MKESDILADEGAFFALREGRKCSVNRHHPTGGASTRIILYTSETAHSDGVEHIKELAAMTPERLEQHLKRLRPSQEARW